MILFGLALESVGFFLSYCLKQDYAPVYRYTAAAALGLGKGDYSFFFFEIFFSACPQWFSLFSLLLFSETQFEMFSFSPCAPFFYFIFFAGDTAFRTQMYAVLGDIVQRTSGQS